MNPRLFSFKLFFFGNLSAGIKILRVKRDADGSSRDVIFHNLSFHNRARTFKPPLLSWHWITGAEKETITNCIFVLCASAPSTSD